MSENDAESIFRKGDLIFIQDGAVTMRVAVASCAVVDGESHLVVVTTDSVFMVKASAFVARCERQSILDYLPDAG